MMLKDFQCKILVWGLWLVGYGIHLEAETKLDFNRDIKPILSDRCFHCHGQDTDNQKSDYRLDLREEALKDLGDGSFGIVAGEPHKSQVVERILSKDPDDMMPPPKSELSLTEEEKEKLIRWIEEGAEYDKHWAFKPIKKVHPPALSQDHKNWAMNEIDAFVAKKLDEKKLQAENQADPYTLIRRLSLDLRGIPPRKSEVTEYIHDKSSKAYENLVDRFLSSPSYGERMALVWMDASRYADSAGYQNDFKRTQWPWRDWVIKAYNDNKPFDQFSIEQLAGDLLPNSTASQRLATAFNRNHRINNEGGIIPEEFLVEYVADRVETTSTVWLGLTAACARCHNHKYDPISQKDYFEMFAFFHNIPENGRDGGIAPKPNMAYYVNKEDQYQHQELKNQVEKLKQKKHDLEKQVLSDFESWMKNLEKKITHDPKLSRPIVHFSFDAPQDKKERNLLAPHQEAFRPRAKKIPLKFVKSQFHQGALVAGQQQVYVKKLLGEDVFSSRQAYTMSMWFKLEASHQEMITLVDASVSKQSQSGFKLKLLPSSTKGKYKVYFELIENQIGEKILRWESDEYITLQDYSNLTLGLYGRGKTKVLDLLVNGQSVRGQLKEDAIEEDFKVHIPLRLSSLNASGGTQVIYDDFKMYYGILDQTRLRRLSQMNPQMYEVQYPSSPLLKKYLKRKYMNFYNKGFANLNKQIKSAEKKEKEFAKAKQILVSIMKEMDHPRKTYRLERGLYSAPDKSEILKAKPFSALPLMQEKLPLNRLGFARWLFQDNHPLTARVAVNRLWQMLFSKGLVKTSDDFGSQGSPPSHPELLDWLAFQYMQDWDTKALLKKMVMSASYRQSSKVSAEKRAVDPDNSLLSRGPRHRLNGPLLRDQALAVSGLLAYKQGGPPVMPYQPKGLWEEVSAKGYKYIEGKGEDLYRKSLYTFWRRTVPPPSMMNFDSSSRDTCSVSQSTTNTPLQALNLMNDPQFVEAARVLAQAMILQGGDSIDEQIKVGIETVLIRPAKENEKKRLLQSYQRYLDYYEKYQKQAEQLVKLGSGKPSKAIRAIELASMTMIATTLLNLDETVNKE